jgi:hypothetical protein
MEGGTFRNCTFIGHQRGMVIGDGAKRVRVDGGEFSSNYQDGIFIGGSGTLPEEATVEGAWCWSNGTGGVGSGVYCANGKRHTVTRNRFGNVGESFQDYGARVDASCTDVAVTWNHTIGATNAAYAIGTPTSLCVRLVKGNTIDPLYVTTAYGGQTILPVEYDYSIGGLRRVFLTTRATMTTTPAFGSWLVGDTIDFADPISGGYAGSKCTVSGAPGKWKNYGAIT